MENVIELKKVSGYEQAIKSSKKARWEISDVLQNETFDFSAKFLPDGLSMVNDLDFMNSDDKVLLSHVQGRSYANIFGLVERFINAKVLEVSQDHILGDQVALEALVRFSDEELKHQELFRLVDKIIENELEKGYEFIPDPNEVAKIVLSKSNWSVLAITLHIELFTQKHYKESIKDNANLSEDFTRIFKFHWMEEAQHALLDELELKREHEKLSDAEIDEAVTDLIDLINAVSEICLAQARSDANYFCAIANTPFSESEQQQIVTCFEKAYIFQYISSGVPEFAEKLLELLDNERFERIKQCVAPFLEMTNR